MMINVAPWQKKNSPRECVGGGAFKADGHQLEGCEKHKILSAYQKSFKSLITAYVMSSVMSFSDCLNDM